MAPRRPLLAVLLTLAMPGLGHLYCGRTLLGPTIWLGAATLLCGLLLAWARWLFVPVGAAAVLAIAWLLLLFTLARDVRRLARAIGPGYVLRPANHWITYLGFALGLGVLPLLATAWFVGDRLVGSVQVADRAMFPRLLVGDQVVFDRDAFEQAPPEPGDLVVYRRVAATTAPGELAVARVIATGRQTVHLEGGRPSVDGAVVERQLGALRVPALGESPDADQLAALAAYREVLQGGGRSYIVTYSRGATRRAGPPQPITLGNRELFVIGDNRSHALARGLYGRLSLDDVAGRPSFVWASWDLAGTPRLGRIGLRVR